MTTAEELLPQLEAASADKIPYDQPGGNWGDARTYRQIMLIEAAGGRRHAVGGYLLPDGSLLRSEHQQWVARDAAWVEEAKTGVYPNDIGLVRHQWCDWGSSLNQRQLAQQLDDIGIAYAITPLGTMGTMAGLASVLTYTSPKGEHIAVLVIPHNANGDDPADEYYSFAMTPDEATEADWVDLYTEARQFLRRP